MSAGIAPRQQGSRLEKSASRGDILLDRNDSPGSPARQDRKPPEGIWPPNLSTSASLVSTTSTPAVPIQRNHSSMSTSFCPLRPPAGWASSCGLPSAREGSTQATGLAPTQVLRSCRAIYEVERVLAALGPI